MEKVIYWNSMIEPKGGVYSAPVIILIITLIVVILIITGLLIGIINSIKNTTITLTGKELIIKTFFYGRKIPLENIDKNGIRAINLNENPEYNVSIKTSGMSLPNLHLGWMRLKNGTKALVFLTDKSSVVQIPAKDFIILFSMNNINEFISRIKSL